MTWIKLRGDRLKPWMDKEVEPNYNNPQDYLWHGAKEIIQTQLVKGQSLTMPLKMLDMSAWLTCWQRSPKTFR